MNVFEIQLKSWEVRLFAYSAWRAPPATSVACHLCVWMVGFCFGIGVTRIFCWSVWLLLKSFSVASFFTLDARFCQRSWVVSAGSYSCKDHTWPWEESAQSSHWNQIQTDNTTQVSEWIGGKCFAETPVPMRSPSVVSRNPHDNRATDGYGAINRLYPQVLGLWSNSTSALISFFALLFNLLNVFAMLKS